MKFLKCATDFTFQKLFACQVPGSPRYVRTGTNGGVATLAEETTQHRLLSTTPRKLRGRWDEGGLARFLSSAGLPRLPATCRKRTAARAASSFQLPPVNTTQAMTQALSHFLQTNSGCLAPSPSQHSKPSREKQPVQDMPRDSGSDEPRLPAVRQNNIHLNWF